MDLDYKSSCTQKHFKLFKNSCSPVYPSNLNLLSVSQCLLLLSCLLLREAVQLCHVCTYTSSVVRLLLFPGDEALFAAHLSFLEVSKEEKLQREEWAASPERMVHRVHILFALMYAVVVCNCLMTLEQACAFSVLGKL